MEKLSHVPSQPAVVPRPRSMVSRDKRLPLDTWNLSGTQDLIKEFFTPRIKVPQVEFPLQRSSGRLVAKGEEQTGITIPIPIFARRPSTMSSFSPAMSDQQRLHISELHFDKFSTTSTLSCWKIRFKNQGWYCSDLLSEAMLWIKEVEMVDSVDDSKSSRSIKGY